MSKKKQLQVAKKKSLISAVGKSKISVITDVPEVSIEEYEKELERLQESFDRIRAIQYSMNAALERIQSRTFRDISYARMVQLLNKESEAKQKKA